MRALRLQWSRAFSLVCEVALRVSALMALQMGLNHGFEAVKGKIGCSVPPSHPIYTSRGTLNFVFSVPYYLELHDAIYMYKYTHTHVYFTIFVK